MSEWFESRSATLMVETRVSGSGTKRANGIAMHHAEHVVRFYGRTHFSSTR